MSELGNLVEQVRHASREMVRELGFLEEVYADGGMPHSQCHALMEIEKQGEMLLGELSERLRLDKSTTSRTVKALVKQGWARLDEDAGDRRRKPLTLTAKGRKRVALIHCKAGARVEEALAVLDGPDRAAVLRGLHLYARALERSRRLARISIRLIAEGDDPEVARLIRKVMPEFGASGPGFAIHDPEVAAMSRAYCDPRSRYFVLEENGTVVGGAGFAPLSGGPAGVCELRKMYLLSGVRGLGCGQRLLDRCLGEAARAGFHTCYLETLKNMHQARALYERNGFARVDKPMGSTGHFGCDAWYVKKLDPDAKARSGN